MQRNASSFPLSGGMAAVILSIAAAVALLFPHTPAPYLALCLPAMYVATALLEFATVALLTILFARTGRQAFFALAITLFAGGVLTFITFLTLHIPALPSAIVPLAGNAPPYVFLLWHGIMPAGAIWYATARKRADVLASVDAQRVMSVTFPLALVTIVAGALLIVVAAPFLPSMASGMGVVAFRQSLLAYIDVPLTLAALVVLARIALTVTVDSIDVAVFLVTITSANLLAISLSDIDRFSVAWISSRALDLVSSTFILTATISDLIGRLTDRLRADAAAMRAEATAYQQNADVQASLVKSRFVAMISHELRTPLGGIIGMAELLERTPLSREQHFCTAAIRGSADTLLRVVNDLLDFSRSESGQLEIESIPFDLTATIEDVAALSRPHAQRNGVAVHVYIDPLLPRVLVGDPTRLKQVLHNLMNNAVRFTSEGTIRIEATPEASRTNTFVRFAVHDTGIGIARKAQSRIFDAFVQEDASTSRRFGGTGLGLTIARHLVELMGGTMALRSVVGVGSTFTFTIPLTAADGEPVAMERPLCGLRLLVVERDAATRNLLQRFGTGWEMTVVAAGSLEELRSQETLREEWSPRDVLLFGPSVDARNAAMFVEQTRGAGTAAILLRSEADGEQDRSGFDACLVGPLRQSSLYDTIVELRRNDLTALVAPAVRMHSPAPQRQEHILVAEDNEVNAALLVAQLEFLGFQADVVCDGQSAIDAAVNRPYDLIFMDCQMPFVDGLEASRRIRGAGARAVPIVAVTADLAPGYDQTCIAAGMNDFLGKPALLEPVTAIVARWLPATDEIDRGMRERLRSIFGRDDERVERAIARTKRSLAMEFSLLAAALERTDGAAVARIAHKVKGIALEAGLTRAAEHARALESEASEAAWDAARQHVEALERAAGIDRRTVEGTTS